MPLDDSGTTPRVGLLWKAQGWMSLYGNYAGNLTANSGSDYLGNPLKSSHARQYKAGVKAEGFQGKLRATLAYFDLNKTNVPTTDPAHPNFQLVVGELGSKGAELDIQGQVRPSWNLILAYAHTDTRVLQSNDSTCNSTGSSLRRRSISQCSCGYAQLLERVRIEAGSNERAEAWRRRHGPSLLDQRE